MSALIREIAGKYFGPILVVGGGMRALSDFQALRDIKFAAVVSANAHGFKIPNLYVDYVVSKDHYHTENGIRMERLLRPYGAPIIGRHHWADYRVPDWNILGNSGIMAIGVAAVLGGAPIYPIGFDFYQEGTYWHDPNAKNVSRRKHPSDSKRKALQLAEHMFGTRVQAMSGPLLDVFKTTKGEFNYRPPAILTKYKEQKGLYVEAVHEFGLPFDARARIIPPRRFWLSETEYQHKLVRDSVRVLDSMPTICDTPTS